MLLLHIGAFQLDTDSTHRTSWHRLVPSTRVLCAVLFVLAAVLTPNGRWQTWAVYATGLAALLLLSRVTFSVLLRRLAVESSFVGVMILGTLFREGGEVLWRWGWLQVTTVGLIVLGSVACKTVLSLVMMNFLTMTTPIPQLLQAMIRLRVPPLLVAILASMYRYIAVIVDEFDAMKRAAIARNLMSHPRNVRRVVGSMFGSLFIRSYERGDRVHHAMLSRGYTGVPVTLEEQKGDRRDIVAITLTMILALTGQIIYLIK